MKVLIGLYSLPEGYRGEFSFINDAEECIKASSIDEVKSFIDKYKSEVGTSRGVETFFDFYPEEATSEEIKEVEKLLKGVK